MENVEHCSRGGAAAQASSFPGISAPAAAASASSGAASSGAASSSTTAGRDSRASTSDAPFVEDMLASPRLVMYVERLQEVLRHEHRRREAFQSEAPVDQRAEFINGEIVVSEPADAVHGRVKNRLHTLLSAYLQVLHTYELGQGATVRAERMLVSLTRNDYEPDIVFYGKKKTRSLTESQWQLPAPDFVAEVLSPDSEERARGVKFEDYAAHGVGEYWIIDPRAQVVEQYVLEPATGSERKIPSEGPAGQYALRAKVKQEPLESVAIDGFCVPASALFDDRANLEALRTLLG